MLISKEQIQSNAGLDSGHGMKKWDSFVNDSPKLISDCKMALKDFE